MNIYDIAKEAGVSPATVSRVLNGKTNVKEATRKSVMDVIEKMGYKPNLVARNLSTGACRNIAYLVPDIDNDFFAQVLQGISDCAYKNDYNVFMYGTGENSIREHQILETLESGMIGGLLITPVSDIDTKTAEFLIKFEKMGIPVVLVDRDIKGIKLEGVFSNDYEGAYEAVECLIQAGHQKIAIIHGSMTSRPGYKRYAGYENALKDHDIEIREEYVVDGHFLERESYEAMAHLMNLTDPPTAVFTSNNLETLGAIKFLNENDYKIGEDVSLVSFDDIRVLAYTNIQITSVARPVYEMGYEAMNLLMHRLNDLEMGVERGPRTVRYNMETWLIRRGSERMKGLTKINLNE